MKKTEFLEMLQKENTEDKTKGLYSDVLDCIDIALSQESDDFEVKDTSKGLGDFYKLLETKARNEKLQCIGPFQTAEMFAKELGAKYERLSKKSVPQKESSYINLEDFL